MADPVSAIRALPRFTYLSREDAREVVIAVLRSVKPPMPVFRRRGVLMVADDDEATAMFRAAIDALVAEIEGNT